MQWVFNFAFFEQYSHFFRHIQNKVTMCTPTENTFCKAQSNYEIDFFS
jgi:hypothetical protein